MLNPSLKSRLMYEFRRFSRIKKFPLKIKNLPKVKKTLKTRFYNNNKKLKFIVITIAIPTINIIAIYSRVQLEANQEETDYLCPTYLFPSENLNHDLQWRADGGANGATAPGIHPGGIQEASFRKQMQVNDSKKEKTVVTGA